MIKRDPRSAAAHEYRGSAYAKKATSTTGSPTFPSASGLSPERAAWCNRAAIYVTKGEFGKAIAGYSEAIRLDAADAGAHLGRGSAHAPGRAISTAPSRTFTAVINRDTRSAAAYEYRGTALRQKGDLDNAVADFSEGIRLEPKKRVPVPRAGGGLHHERRVRRGDRRLYGGHPP